MAELRFDITGNTTSAQRAVRDLAGVTDAASRGARVLADSLDKQKRAAAASAGATIAAAKADKILADASDEAIASFVAEKEALDRDRKAKEENAAATAALATSSRGAASGASALVSPMGGLVAAGVALSPVILTIGTGLAGLGVAAVGVISPILKASQAAGGLQANMAKLDPEQRTVARSILGLQGAYSQFQKALQPVLVKDFNAAIALAGPLLHDIEPVAQATGTALAQLFAQVGATFRSGEWQNFFGFMAKTAGPDIKLLGNSFAALADALPGLLIALQPIATEVLRLVQASATTIDQVSQLVTKFGQLKASADNMSKSGGFLNDTLSLFSKHANDAAKFSNPFFLALHGINSAMDHIAPTSKDAAKGINAVAIGAQNAGNHIGTMAQQVVALNTAESKSLNTQLAYSNALIAAGNDAKTLRQALTASGGAVGLHTAAERASFSAANTYISDLQQAATQAVASGRGATGAARAIQNGLPVLEQAARHNRLLWQEVQTLKDWLDKLRLEKPIREAIAVRGLGSWSVVAAKHALAQGPGPFAAGGRVPGSGSGDTFPAMLTPGEVVVPRGMVTAGAVDHLRGSLPGFASGGIAGSYGGGVGGLQPWAARNVTATNQSLFVSMANAITSAIHASIRASMAAAAARAAATFGAGPGGGAPAANAALARRLMPAWASGANWAGWNYVAMRESGWNQFARNPSSGAYGIPQALPPGKMGAAANPPQSNPSAQIRWMIGYINQRYQGSPINAANHERAFNWYDRGGALPPGVSLAVNNTGRPEQVLGPGSLAETNALLREAISLLRIAPVATSAGTAKALNSAARGALR